MHKIRSGARFIIAGKKCINKRLDMFTKSRPFFEEMLPMEC